MGADWKTYDANMASNIFYVEKELGAYITDDYPLIKLISQVEHLQEHYENSEKEKKRNNNTLN